MCLSLVLEILSCSHHPFAKKKLSFQLVILVEIIQKLARSSIPIRIIIDLTSLHLVIWVEIIQKLVESNIPSRMNINFRLYLERWWPYT